MTNKISDKDHIISANRIVIIEWQTEEITRTAHSSAV